MGAMREHPDNPSLNMLLQGTPEASLIEAIVRSGYPLQGVIASHLIADFLVLEEWGFPDEDTDQHRTLDLYAQRSLKPASAGPGSREGIQPRLTLLIECKRSRHPFVFFRQVVDRPVPSYPPIVGVRPDTIFVSDQQRNVARAISIQFALGMSDAPFVRGGPAVCSSLAKAVVNGSKVELSGNEPYNGLVLPLIKGLRRIMNDQLPQESGRPLYPTLVLPLAVLDAPMLLVEQPAQADDPVLTPWVRVIRHESREPEVLGGSSSRFYGIDVVHAAFFPKFLADHVMPFAQFFAERAVEAEAIVRRGGVVPNIDEFRREDISAR